MLVPFRTPVIVEIVQKFRSLVKLESSKRSHQFVFECQSEILHTLFEKPPKLIEDDRESRFKGLSLVCRTCSAMCIRGYTIGTPVTSERRSGSVTDRKSDTSENGAPSSMTICSTSSGSLSSKENTKSYVCFEQTWSSFLSARQSRSTMYTFGPIGRDQSQIRPLGSHITYPGTKSKCGSDGEYRRLDRQ